MDEFVPNDGWLEGAADTDIWIEGWLDVELEALSNSLGTKLDTRLPVEFALSWLNGAAETDEFANGTDNGWLDALGNSVGIDDGAGVI